MKTPKYLKRNNLPPQISILHPLLWWLVLERFNAPGWLYGVIYTIVVVVYLAEAWRLFAGQEVDLLGNDANGKG